MCDVGLYITNMCLPNMQKTNKQTKQNKTKQTTTTKYHFKCTGHFSIKISKATGN